MKLESLRPCDACGGSFKSGVFYVLRFSLAVIDRQTAGELLGLAQFFGGPGNPGAMTIAGVFADRNDAVKVAMDDKDFEGLRCEAFLCADCYTKPVILGQIAEKVAKRQEDVDAAKAGE